jgi:hypothetical protein
MCTFTAGNELFFAFCEEMKFSLSREMSNWAVIGKMYVQTGAIGVKEHKKGNEV